MVGVSVLALVRQEAAANNKVLVFQQKDAARLERQALKLLNGGSYFDISGTNYRPRAKRSRR